MTDGRGITTPPSLRDTLRDHRGRIRGTEGPVVGQWVYVTPIAPAATPIDAVPADPLSPAFQNGWGNAPLEQAVSFRIHPATVVKVRGSLEGGTLPSVVFTLPAGFRPAKPEPVSFPSGDGSAVFTGRIDPTGDVWILEELISEVTSVDLSVTVTNPRGPTVDLAVAVVDGGSA